MKFKVGDEVEVINIERVMFGFKGIIKEFTDNKYPIVVEVYNDGKRYFTKEDLKLLRTKEEIETQCKLGQQIINNGPLISNEEADKSLRFNSSKVEQHTLPSLGVIETCKVSMVGAAKYAPNNWRKPSNVSEYLNAMFRHLQKYQYGEDVDKETKCLHLAHIAWNTLALIEKTLTNSVEDDRYKIDLDLDDVLKLNEEQKEVIKKLGEKK
jgi:hypothetical protein